MSSSNHFKRRLTDHEPSLIAKWKKPGYEKLCCVRCIQSKVRFQPRYLCGIDASQDMNYQGSTCICRVPKAQVKAGTIVECVHCGESLAQIQRTKLTAFQGAEVVAQIHKPSTLSFWLDV